MANQDEARTARTTVQVVEAHAADQARRIMDLPASATAATERAREATTAQARLEGDVGALRQQVDTLLARVGWES